MVSLHYGLFFTVLFLVVFVDMSRVRGNPNNNEDDSTDTSTGVECSQNSTCVDAVNKNRKKNIFCNTTAGTCYCKEGFKLNGKSKDCWECEGNSAKHFNCEKRHGPNATCIVNEKRCGCDSGFVFEEYANEGNRCTPEACDQPPAGTNTTEPIHDKTLSPNEAYYECIPEHYTQTGNTFEKDTSTFCILPEMTWTAPPTCVPKTCPSPPQGTNTMEPSTSVESNVTIATYMCMEGYGLPQGDNYTSAVNVSCGLSTNFTWPFAPACESLCGDADYIDNGEVATTDLAEGGVQALYTCNDGYDLEGNETVNCSASSDWTYTPAYPTCDPIDACGDPDNIAYGQWSTTNLTDDSVEATYTCDEGYDREGNNPVQCNAGSNWTFTPAPPTCTPSGACGNPENIDNGQWSTTNQTDDSVEATYTCNTGYVLEGNGNVHCDASSGWKFTPAPQTCSPSGSCKEPDNIDNGHSSTTNQPDGGVEVTYTCDEGYVLQGDHPVQCNASSDWKFPKPTPICSPSDSCGNPENIDNGQWSTTNQTDDSVEATYTCNTGYVLEGNGNVHCDASSGWKFTPAPQTCSPSGSCKEPDNIDNGHSSTTNQPDGGVEVTYTCDEGYVLQGDHPVQCNASSDWKFPKPTPICSPSDSCGNPDDIAYGHWSTTNQTYGGVEATYTCNTGYVLEGNGNVHCDASSGWKFTPAPPTCSPSGSCKEPDNIDNGHSSTTNQPDGGVEVTYTCDEGYVLQGDHPVQCNASSDWKFPKPTPICSPSDSCTPTEEWRGHHKVTSRSRTAIVGDTVVVYCDLCYEIFGSSIYVVVCSKDGQWKGLDGKWFDPHDSTLCTQSDCGSNSSSESSSSESSSSESSSSSSDDGCGCDCNCC